MINNQTELALLIVLYVFTFSPAIAQNSISLQDVPESPQAIRLESERRVLQRAIVNAEQIIKGLDRAIPQAEIASSDPNRLRAQPPNVEPSWLSTLVLPSQVDLDGDVQAAADASERARKLAAALRNSRANLSAAIVKARNDEPLKGIQRLTSVVFSDADRTVIESELGKTSSPLIIALDGAPITLDFPATGAVLRPLSEKIEGNISRVIVCSATLIGPRLLLTAAHCFCGTTSATNCKPPNRHLPSTSASAHDLRADLANWRVYLAHSGIYAIDSIVLDKEYVYAAPSSVADLALIVLSENVDEIRPLGFSRTVSNLSAVSATAVGFGRYNQPYMVASTVMFAGPTAEAGIKATAEISTSTCSADQTEMLCWHYGGGFSSGSICSGDSGGTLIGQENEIIGALNGGTGLDLNGIAKCQTGSDAWATNVTLKRNTDWLNATIAGLSSVVGSTSDLVDALNPVANTSGRFLLNRVVPGDVVDAQLDEDIAVGRSYKRLLVSINASRAVDASGKPFEIHLNVVDPTGSNHCVFAGRQQAHVCEVNVSTLGHFKLSVTRAAYQDMQVGVVGYVK